MALKTVGSSPITHPMQRRLPRCHRPGKAQIKDGRVFSVRLGSGAHPQGRILRPASLQRRTSSAPRNHPPLPDNGMSPSGKAPDFDSGIRRFESCHPSHVGRRQLHSVSAVSVRAAKTPYPQPPSSFSPPDPLRWAPAGAPGENDSPA